MRLLALIARLGRAAHRAALRRAAPRAADERGSAVVEYVLVSAVVALMFAGTVQLALALHVRNTLIDAAAAGARYGTLADRSPQDGVERTREIITGHLGPRYAQDVSAATAAVGDTDALQIQVVSPLPVVAMFGPPDGMRVRGHAVADG